MQLAVVLGAVALLLAGVGVFGVISFGVSQRSREIGLRLALGASRGSVQLLVVRQAMKLVLFGAAAGTLAVPMIGRAIRSLLFGVKPFDAFTFVAASMLLVGATLMACWLPARKAGSADPMEVLRHE
jgi:putative ABC transport system permease protein